MSLPARSNPRSIWLFELLSLLSLTARVITRNRSLAVLGAGLVIVHFLAMLVYRDQHWSIAPQIVLLHICFQTIAALIFAPLTGIALVRRNKPIIYGTVMWVMPAFILGEMVVHALWGTFDFSLERILGLLAFNALVLALVFAIYHINRDLVTATFVELGYAPQSYPHWNMEDDDALRTLLPKEVRARVLRVESNQKYVTIYTENGKHTMRKSFREVNELLKDAAGMAIHRSHWVRHSLVKDLTYHNGNPKLVLTTGEVLPVSRAKVNALKALI